MSDAAPTYHHATAVIVGECGVLIRGESASGKSALAQALLLEGALCGRFVRLVGDDRVSTSVAGGRLIARSHPAIAGLLEHRGEGLVATPFERAAVIAAVIDFVSEKPARYPSDTEKYADIAGVRLPRLALPSLSSAHSASAVPARDSARQVMAFVQRQFDGGASWNG